MEREKEALTKIAQAHEFEIISLGGAGLSGSALAGAVPTLVEKARELLPVPEVQQPEREQERSHTWDGMEL